MISLSRKALVFVAAAWAIGPRPATAQTARPLELSAAYVYVRESSIDVTFPAGWAVGVAKGVNGWLSIAAAYDDSWNTTSTVAGDLRLGVRTLMAGPRASARLGRATQFGQLLFGAGRQSGSAFGITESSTYFSALVGAGIDYPLSRHVSLRAELDYRLVGLRHAERARQVRGLTGVAVTLF
jgi:hypothetical protein